MWPNMWKVKIVPTSRAAAVEPRINAGPYHAGYKPITDKKKKKKKKRKKKEERA